MARLAFRPGIKRWYAVLVALWLVGAISLVWRFANGPHHRAGSAAEAWSNFWELAPFVFDPRLSLSLLRGDLWDLALLILIWLPLLAAPFGLLTRIDPE